MSQALLNEESSIDRFLAGSTQSEEKIDALNDYCMVRIDQHNTDTFKQRTLQCQDLLAQTNYPRGLAYHKVAKAFLLMGQSKLMDMKKVSEESIHLFETLNDNNGMLFALVGDVFGKLVRGDFDEALQQSIKAIKLADSVETSMAKGWSTYAMAVVYFDIKDYTNSKKYYKLAAEIFNTFNQGYISARARTGAGTCSLHLGEYEEAKTSVLEVIAYFKEHPNPEGMSRATNDLGVLYTKTKDFEKAEQLLLQTFDIRNKLNNKRAVVTTMLDLAELYICSSRSEEAIDHLNIALELTVEHKAQPKEMRAQKLLFTAHKALGNINKSFDALEKYVQLHEKIANTETNNKLKLQESNFVSEKAKQLAELERKKNIELKAAHDEISTKNQAILDSIKYAQRIQAAILPPTKLINKCLPNSFVLYKPKDIVAGDFYWVESRNSEVFFAAADCTGHGVPGAMVSVICNGALNRSVREFKLTDPGRILEKTRELVIQEFEKSEEEVKDGMDIALCKLVGTTLSYSGANNPLWIVRNEEIIEVKADKQPIGKHITSDSFTTHTLEVQKEDVIYIFTDGYADQFGGQNDKKFGKKNFRSLLLSMQQHSMAEQQKHMDQEFENWKGAGDQIDDVCVIGIKIGT